MNQHTTNLPNDLTITSQGFGILRKELIKNIGVQRANFFLFRFGRDLGVSKAEELKSNYTSVRDLLKIASDIHKNLGHVSGVESLGHIIVEPNGLLRFENVKGKWLDSFEAKLHLEHFGPSTSCTCYTLSGFASGYLSAIYNQDVYSIETACQSMGHSHCSFEINVKEYWLEKDPTNEIFHHNPTVLEELSLTYDTLLQQKKDLNKMLTYHSELSDCVIKEDSLNHVLSTAFDILDIPIVIKNVNNKILACRGITEEDYFTHTINQKKSPAILNNHNETVYKHVGTLYEMTTPVKLDYKKFATCSFIYSEKDAVAENDHVFLERLASVATLCFMKEKIRFETTERLKISVLDQLINQEHTSLNEITLHLNYIANNIEGPYYLLKIKFSNKENHYVPVDAYDQLIQFAQTFRLFYIDILSTVIQSDVVVLIYNSKPLPKLQQDLKKVLRQIERNNPNIDYKIGVSSQFTALTELKSYLKQASHAVHLPRPAAIISYEELGILGNFLSNTDVETLKQIAAEELKDLLKDEPKNRELLYTLYIYLMNGKHLEKTMQTLTLSMGGLQYRIRKIEELTGKNLKEFYTASYLFLLIESLITTGEIKWP
ncbi:MAG: V4R domain-containing protein [Solibacillus sp.]